MEHWRENPPEHLLLKWQMGYKGAAKMKEETERREAAADHQFTRMTNSRTWEQVPEYVRKALEALPGGPGPISD